MRLRHRRSGPHGLSLSESEVCIRSENCDEQNGRRKVPLMRIKQATLSKWLGLHHKRMFLHRGVEAVAGISELEPSLPSFAREKFGRNQISFRQCGQ